jgi:hypothetical protein
MKTRNFIRGIFIGFGVSLLLLQGCSPTGTAWHYYMQRTPIRVVVVPSENKTEHPDASVVFNKACEEALAKKGFDVIAADEVVTYASSRGLLLGDVAKLKSSEIAKDLKADMVLYSVINTWDSEYVVLNTRVHVSGTSRLVEAGTEALVWRYTWDLRQDSSSGNSGGVVGLLVGAAVTAVANSAFDACADLGAQAAGVTVSSLPQPGFAPEGSRPQHTSH